MTINNYVDFLNKRFQTGISREHAYRGDLQVLLETLAPDILVTNEPARIACGAPDYVLTRENIPIGYIEAKDIGINLKSKSLKEQFDRYRKSLPNLIFTDYLDFHFYTDGDFITSVAIAEIQDGKIVPITKNFEHFTALMNDFVTTVSQSIKSSEKLSQMMANKAKLLANVIGNALESDVQNQQNTSLQQQLSAFEQILIHGITPREFADIYAQTIAYGMFAARLHDPTLNTFSRQEAAELIPQSNPFLRKMFHYIAGYDLDTRIVWIVDALADIFRATDVAALLQDFGKSTQMMDPMIHFYENFLAEYDPKLRKARGVWYTPEPVVKFIVRAVDEVLKTEFGLKKGLADTSKTKNDSLTIKHTIIELKDVIEKFKKLSKDELIEELSIKDSAGWKIQSAQNDIRQNKGSFTPIQYRLFDNRYTYFTGKSSGFIGRTRGKVMEDMLKENYSLIFKRTGKIYGETYDFFFISKSIISEGLFVIDPLGREYLAPLYKYEDESSLFTETTRKPNLDPKIVVKIAKGLGLQFTAEKENALVDTLQCNVSTFAPIDILDYIYAVLHSPTYRETYKEFLKIDFPRVPFPHDSPQTPLLKKEGLQKRFWELVKLGGELRQLHLLESETVEEYITGYPEEGDNIVTRKMTKSSAGYVATSDTHGNVWINDEQYFENVPLVAWEFYIGGYQPAQKWLKDRKERELSFDDILHYQKIIVALTETDRLMQAIDEVFEV